MEICHIIYPYRVVRKGPNFINKISIFSHEFFYVECWTFEILLTCKIYSKAKIYNYSIYRVLALSHQFKCMGTKISSITANFQPHYPRTLWVVEISLVVIDFVVLGKIFRGLQKKFYIISPCKKTHKTHKLHLESLHLRFGWNWFSDEGFAKRARATNGKFVPAICLKMKMIEKVLKSGNSENESLLILCLWLWHHFLTVSCSMTS